MYTNTRVFGPMTFTRDLNPDKNGTKIWGKPLLEAQWLETFKSVVHRRGKVFFFVGTKPSISGSALSCECLGIIVERCSLSLSLCILIWMEHSTMADYLPDLHPNSVVPS